MRTDKDFKPHESWCDTENKISDWCNCMASTYIERIREAEKAMSMGAFHHSSCGNNWYAEPGVSNKPMPCACAREKVTEYFNRYELDEKVIANEE